MSNRKQPEPHTGGIKPPPPPAPPPAAGPSAPTHRPRSLFLTELRLHQAWSAMETADPNGEMSADEAEAFIATYCNPVATLDARDELGDFLVGMQAFADAKRAAAVELQAQARRLETGIERMKASTLRTMAAFNVEDLMGHHRRLHAKKSRGAVAIDDDKAIPSEYLRVPEDNEDLVAIGSLVMIVVEVLAERIRPGEKIEETLAFKAAQHFLDTARARHQVVDKRKIQEAWKDAGGDTFGDEGVPVVPGVHREITTTLEVK